MKLPSKLLLLAALLIILSSSRTSFGGQPFPGQTFTCSSINNRRNWCDLPRRNVNLSRQISGSPCIQGQTWGRDDRGIWVDRGCRAEFTIDGNRRGRPGNWGGQTLTCSSNNNRRNWCGFPRRNVNLSRQISGSPCIQGQTWGSDDRGIWVDRGCRAEFLVR